MEEMGGRWSDGRGARWAIPAVLWGYDAAQYGRWRRAGEMSGASLIHESTYNLRCNARYQICSLEVSGTLAHLAHLAHRAPTTTTTHSQVLDQATALQHPPAALEAAPSQRKSPPSVATAAEPA